MAHAANCQTARPEAASTSPKSFRFEERRMPPQKSPAPTKVTSNTRTIAGIRGLRFNQKPKKTTAATAKTPPTRTAHQAPSAYSPLRSVGGNSPRSRRRSESGSGSGTATLAGAVGCSGFAGRGGGAATTEATGVATTEIVGAASEGTATGTATGLAGVTESLLSMTAKRCSSDFTSPMSMKKRIGR